MAIENRIPQQVSLGPDVQRAHGFARNSVQFIGLAHRHDNINTLNA